MASVVLWAAVSEVAEGSDTEAESSQRSGVIGMREPGYEEEQVAPAAAGKAAGSHTRGRMAAAEAQGNMRTEYRPC